MQKLREAPVRRRRIERGTEEEAVADTARRASEGDIGAQRASGKVRDSGFGDITCLEGASSECSLAWDRSDLWRGPWENSLE